MKEAGGFEYDGYEGHHSLRANLQGSATTNIGTTPTGSQNVPSLNGGSQDILDSELPHPNGPGLPDRQSPLGRPESNEGSATTASVSEHSTSMSPLSSLRRKTPDLSALGLGFTANIHGVTPRRIQENPANSHENDMRSTGAGHSQRAEKSSHNSVVNPNRKSPRKGNHSRKVSHASSSADGGIEARQRQPPPSGAATVDNNTHADYSPSVASLQVPWRFPPPQPTPGASLEGIMRRGYEHTRPGPESYQRENPQEYSQPWTSSTRSTQAPVPPQTLGVPIDRFMDNSPVHQSNVELRPRSYRPPRYPRHTIPSPPDPGPSGYGHNPGLALYAPGPWMDVYNSPQMNQGFSNMLSGYSISHHQPPHLDGQRTELEAPRMSPSLYNIRENRGPSQVPNGVPMPADYGLMPGHRSLSVHSSAGPSSTTASHEPATSQRYVQWGPDSRADDISDMGQSSPQNRTAPLSSASNMGRPSRRASRTHRRNNTSRTIEGLALPSAPFASLDTVTGDPSDTISGPTVSERPPGGFYWGLSIDPDRGAENDLGGSTDGGDDILPIQLYEPPLHNCVPVYPQALEADQQLRPRKKSKYTPEQDQLILELKNAGQGWAEIAERAGCDNHLAARNRYQVLIGQQGGSTFFWTTEDCSALQALLDEGERAKWVHIAQELSKKQSKSFSMEQCHYKISEMFSQNPETFGVVKSRDPNQGGAPYKRKPLY